MNPPTELLLRLIGPMFLIVGINLVMNPKQYVNMLNNIKTDALSWYLGALLSLFVGVMMVQFHNVWNNLNEVIISIIGWAALVKGVLLLLKPDCVIKLSTLFVKPKNLGPASWVVVILGGYMCYAGFFV